jgi:hypothetical protein
MPNSQSEPDFELWSEKFWPYLYRESINAYLRYLLAELGPGGRQELAWSIFDYLRTNLWDEFRADRRQTGRMVDRLLSRAIRKLQNAAKEYEKLGQLASGLRPGTLLGSTAPQGFVHALNAEADRLVQQRERARIAFSHKRSGNKSDLAILVRLQDIVDEFSRRSGRPLAIGHARHLTASDLADLLEAGKAALGVAEDETLTDVAPIERSLQRFRKHPHNALISALLKEDAVRACNQLGLGAPTSFSR